MRHLPDMLVSIYIPTFNRCQLLQRAVESARTQTFRDIEIIIVDDCSTDGTHDYLHNICQQDPRIRYFIKPANSGACISRNIAIESARGDYVTGLDDDDYFSSPTRIEDFVREWQRLEAANTPVSCLYSDIVITTQSRWQSHVRKPGIITLTDMFIRNQVGPQAFASKHHFLGTGLFDPAFPAWQDYDFWFRMIALYGPAHKVPGKASYHVDESHGSPRISSSGTLKIRSAYERFSTKHAALLGEHGQLRVRLCHFKSPEIPMGLQDILWFFRHGLYRAPVIVWIKKKLRPLVYGR